MRRRQAKFIQLRKDLLAFATRYANWFGAKRAAKAVGVPTIIAGNELRRMEDAGIISGRLIKRYTVFGGRRGLGEVRVWYLKRLVNELCTCCGPNMDPPELNVICECGCVDTCPAHKERV